jgi:epoxide hydrolase-like predicted phosphatase
MAIRAVFFDLGGVIVRTEYQAPRERLAERLNTTYEDLYKSVFESDTGHKASLGSIPLDEHWTAVARRFGRPASETETIRTEFFAGDVIDRTLLDFIRSLRPQRKTGVISNAWPDMREYLVENKFDDAFDALVLSSEVGITKPDPKIYHMALDKFKVKPEEAVFVDDIPANIEAARALGLQGVLFQSTEQTLKKLKELLR